MKNAYFETDFGLFTSDIRKSRGLAFSSERESVLPSSSNVLYTLRIALEKNKEQVYNRKYIKAT